MLLVFDIGNTNTVMGIFDGDKLVGHWRLTSRKRTADEVGFMIQGMLSSFGIDKGAIDGAIFGSVVPPLDEMIRGGVRKYIGIECLRVTAKLNTGLTIKMKNPTGIGADRIVNAVAAREKYGAPLIVVDLGTAITFDVIAQDGAYLGGAIAPGMELAMESLFSRTAKLPQIELVAPEHVIGGNTVEAIQSGIIYGTVGMADKIIKGIFKELGGPCRVVATGGHAPLIAKYSNRIDTVDQWLTLDLGQVRRIGRIVLNWERSAPLWYAIQLSTDDEHYKEVFEQTEGTQGAYDVVDFAPQEARFIRIDCRARTTQYGFSLYEVEVYPPVKSPAYRCKVWAGASQMPDGAPEYATDGSHRTAWRAPGGKAQWIQFNLGRTRRVARLQIDWGDGAPKSFTVQLSEDGKRFFDAYAATDRPPRSEETIQLTAPRRARYIKLNFKEAAGEGGYMIREFDALP